MPLAWLFAQHVSSLIIVKANSTLLNRHFLMSLISYDTAAKLLYFSFYT